MACSVSNGGYVWENIPGLFIALDVLPVSAVCSLQITGLNRRIMGGAIHTRGAGIVWVPVSEHWIDLWGDSLLGNKLDLGFRGTSVR